MSIAEVRSPGSIVYICHMIRSSLGHCTSVAAAAVSIFCSVFSGASSARAQGVNFPFCLRPHCNTGNGTFGSAAMASPFGIPWPMATWARSFGDDNVSSAILLHQPLLAREPSLMDMISNFRLGGIASPGRDSSMPTAFDLFVPASHVFAAHVARNGGAMLGTMLSTAGLGGSTTRLGEASDPVVACFSSACVAVVAATNNNLYVVSDRAGSEVGQDFPPLPLSGRRATRPAIVRTSPNTGIIIRKQYRPNGLTSIGLTFVSVDTGGRSTVLTEESPSIALNPEGDASVFGSIAATMVNPATLLVGAIQSSAGSNVLTLATFAFPLAPRVTELNRVVIPLPPVADPWVGLAHSNNSIVATIQIQGSIIAETIHVDSATGQIGTRFPFATGPRVNDPATQLAIAHSLVDGPLPLVTFDTNNANPPTRRALGSIVAACLNDSTQCRVQAGPRTLCGTCAEYECRNWTDCTPVDAGVIDSGIIVPIEDVPDPVDVSTVGDLGVLPADVPAATDATEVEVTEPADTRNNASANRPVIKYGGGSCSCRTITANSQHNRGYPALALVVVSAISLRRQNTKKNTKKNAKNSAQKHTARD